MKELIASARNLYFAVDDETKQLLPSVELILFVSEPDWELDANGQPTKSRGMGEVRIVTSPKALLALAASLVEMHKDVMAAAQELAAKSEDEEAGGTS